MKNQIFDYVILGGGIAGLSLANFLQAKAVVVEAENKFGGLSRSYSMAGVDYDIGPHIIFSKNQEVLDLHTSMIQTNQLKRSNKIFHDGRYIKYPFENDLFSLSEKEKQYCLVEFLNNPYESLEATNMLQFFLKTFGDGITRTYLQPYNEKIWKFDPSFMDTQMVERIPKPPKQDVIDSANGKSTDGYTHQLYFHYPQEGGFQTLINEYAYRAKAKGQSLVSSARVQKVKKNSGIWEIETSKGKIIAKSIINTMPIHEITKVLETPPEFQRTVDQLLFNSIYIVMVHVKADTLGDNFAVYVPNKDVIFHRLSKLSFLGDAYVPDDGGSMLMAEITFRPESFLSRMSEDQVKTSVVSDLVAQGFVEDNDVIDVVVRYEKYAYVIYDLNHKKNAANALKYLKSQGIHSCGRFAQFEYLNSDGVVANSLELAKALNG